MISISSLKTGLSHGCSRTHGFWASAASGGEGLKSMKSAVCDRVASAVTQVLLFLLRRTANRLRVLNRPLQSSTQRLQLLLQTPQFVGMSGFDI